MPLSEVQRRIPPLAVGISWREWLATTRVVSPSPAEMQAWVAKVEAERSSVKESLEEQREVARRERKRRR